MEVCRLWVPSGGEVARKARFNRNTRGDSSLARSPARRAPYDYVLIVCEGTSTEPNYLRDLLRDLRLSNANIHVLDRDHGSDPLSVVRAALEQYKRDGEYDRIYCVFDRNGHQTYPQALEMVRTHPLKTEKKLFAINSVPCFEIWLLLHYRYTSAPYTSVGQHSACDRVIADLKKNAELSNYEKSSSEIYATVSPRTATAIGNGMKLAKHNRDANSPNPATRMQELVSYLQTLASQRIVG